MKIKIDVLGLKKWYKQLLDENFYKFLISLGLLASAPVIASVLFDYIVIYGNGRFKAGLLLGIVLLLLFLLLSFISIAIWAAINSNTTGQRRMMLIISAYLMIWLAFGNLYYFFSDTENFVATNTTSVEGLVKEWDGDMHVTELQESTVLRNVPHFWELVPHKDSGGNEQLLPRTVNRLNGYLDCLYFSGVSILTIGYGDIVPESRFLKMLVLLEGFLGQFINVVAIGLWLSGLLAVAAVCLPIGSSVAAEQQISRTGITIPEDTVLQLELMNFLESKRNKVGDTVSVKLLEAVSVADEVIIPKGTVLEGYLKKVQKGKLLSQKGVIRMRLKDYYLPNGYLLRLNNEEIKFSGDMNYTSLAAGVAVPFAGLAFKGKNVSCKPGMQFKYKLAHDVAVERY